MPDIHAKTCSPSGAEGWFACAGRIVMEAGFADADTSFSSDGTARHQFAAEALINGLSMSALVGCLSDNAVNYPPEWVEEDQDYVDTVRILAEGGELFVERRVDFSTFTKVPGDSFGTADAIVLRPITVTGEDGEIEVYELIVIDRKTGYVAVDPECNKQLMLYALGALAEFGMVYEIARVRLVIHQRTAREWDCSIDELLAFGEQAREKAGLVQDAIKERDAIPAETWQRIYLNQDPSEDACRYCKAMATCPSMQAKVQTLVGADFDEIVQRDADADRPAPPSQLNQAALGTIMSAAGLIEDFCKAVRAEVERRLLAGTEVTGFKLVMGKQGNRKWSDDKAAEEMLRKQFRLPVEVAYDLSIISPTTAEKLTKGEKAALGPRQWAKVQALITRAEAKPSVAPVSDRRDAWVPPNAADDFTPVVEAGADLV